MLRRFLFVFLGVVSLACWCGAAETAADSAPLLVLISLDAFRWDYCALHPEAAPNLRRLMAEGASAKALIPVFPSNTFPNHYTIATGLRPAHHGILNNVFFDPTVGEFFHYNQAASVRQSHWWGGEPIWVTATKQGRKSACSFWVGSEAEVEGVRPTYWRVYDPRLSFDARLAEFSRWVTRPPAERPAVITFYLEETNSVGHRHGPDSPELVDAIKLLDGRVVALLDALHAANVEANLIVVSDHGMTSLSVDRVILLDDYLNLDRVQIDFDGPVVGLRPLSGTVEELMDALAKLPPHAHAYRAENLPARFAMNGNPRIPPVWVLPDEGWHVERRSAFNLIRDHFEKGEHGYDPTLTDMRGILIVHGPSFVAGGRVIDPVENIHIYNLMCAALRLKPAPNDGDQRLIKALLKN